MSAMGDYSLWLEETGRTDSEDSRITYLALESMRIAEQFEEAAAEYAQVEGAQS